MGCDDISGECSVASCHGAIEATIYFPYIDGYTENI